MEIVSISVYNLTLTKQEAQDMTRELTAVIKNGYNIPNLEKLCNTLLNGCVQC